MLEVHLSNVAVVPAEERAHRESSQRATSSEEEAERRIWQSVQNEVLAAVNPVEVARRGPWGSEVLGASVVLTPFGS